MPSAVWPSSWPGWQAVNTAAARAGLSSPAAPDQYRWAAIRTATDFRPACGPFRIERSIVIAQEGGMDRLTWLGQRHAAVLTGYDRQAPRYDTGIHPARA